MKRLIALAVVMLNLASAFAAERPPNILFIAIDDLRPELGVYGSPVKSPNIDKLASSGTVFDRAYCQYALCMPSRGSLLTGLRIDTIRMYQYSDRFRHAVPDAVTLPEQFRKHGYHTQAFGKVFHRDDPQSWSVPLTQSRWPWNEYHTDLGKQIVKEIETDYRKLTFTWDLGDGYTKTKPMGGLAWEAPDVADTALHDGDMTDQVICAMNEINDKPFFLAAGYYRPHLPFIAPKKYFDLYDHDKIELASNPFPPKGSPDFALYNWNDTRHYYGIPKIGPVLDDQSRDLRHAYYACVSYVDAQVGRLIDELERLKLRERTVVILWGDHGWQLGEHGMWGKHSNFETSTRVPLIISVPGQEQARTKALVEFVDIYPTLCELCDVPVPDTLEGTSFVPVLHQPDRSWKPAAFSQYRRVIPGHGRGMGYSMRTDRYRLTRWYGAEGELVTTELYDHDSDPQENTNVAGLNENAAIVSKLGDQLDAGWKGSLPKLFELPSFGKPCREDCVQRKGNCTANR